MKLVFTILALFLSLSGIAQNQIFEKEASKTYGTPAERAQQDALEHQSKSQYLCRLVGFKKYYLNELCKYLQIEKGFTVDDTPDKIGFFSFRLTKNGVYMGNIKPPKISLTFTVDASERIKSGVIKGSFADLADLFLNYWPQDAEWSSEVKLKPGIVAQKHSFGDLVTFNWSQSTPYITVNKDPNFEIATSIND